MRYLSHVVQTQTVSTAINFVVFLYLLDLQRRHITPNLEDIEDEEKIAVQPGLVMDYRVQHRLHLVRFDLMQFVNGLHQYIMSRVRTGSKYRALRGGMKCACFVFVFA